MSALRPSPGQAQGTKTFPSYFDWNGIKKYDEIHKNQRIHKYEKRYKKMQNTKVIRVMSALRPAG